MIIRDILKDPPVEIARFDFFNDYKDTRDWLVGVGATLAIGLLDNAHDAWFKKRLEDFRAKQ